MEVSCRGMGVVNTELECRPAVLCPRLLGVTPQGLARQLGEASKNEGDVIYPLANAPLKGKH